MISDSNNQDSLLSSLRVDTAAGYLLVLCGLGVMAAVLYQTYSIFTDPGRLVTFQEVFTDEITISWADGFVTIPPEMLIYFFPLALLSLAGGMGRALLGSGIGLIRKQGIQQNPGSN
jgi:hypothetical protein